jgi:hypothetical protein
MTSQANRKKKKKKPKSFYCGAYPLETPGVTNDTYGFYFFIVLFVGICENYDKYVKRCNT